MRPLGLGDRVQRRGHRGKVEGQRSPPPRGPGQPGSRPAQPVGVDSLGRAQPHGGHEATGPGHNLHLVDLGLEAQAPEVVAVQARRQRRVAREGIGGQPVGDDLGARRGPTGS